MQQRHLDRELYFKEQSYTTKKYVIPYIESIKPIDESMRILEIGCGEGGNMKPFLDMGCTVVGVDIHTKGIQLAENFYSNHPFKKNLTLINNDIFDVKEDMKAFDIIILRDVLEHIHNQEAFLNYAKSFLKNDGLFFIAFPPWQNPFGGHQQVLSSKILSHLPYFHILPKPILTLLLKIFGESKSIQGMLELVDTGISIERYKKIIRTEKYRILKQTYWFINPNYEIKFNLKPREQLKILSSIPYFRNYVTTAYYSVISKSMTTTGIL